MGDKKPGKLKCSFCGTMLDYDRDVDVWICPNGCCDVVPKRGSIEVEEQRNYEISTRRVDYEEARRRMLFSIGKPSKDPLPPVVIIDPKKRSGQKSGKNRKKEFKRSRYRELE